MGGLVSDIFGLDSPPPPDYGPVAQASKEVAEISAGVSREQLAESKRQYDENMKIARPIVDAQKKTMDLAYDQGNESFQAFKTEGRPLQATMRDMALGKFSPEMQREMDAGADRSVGDVVSALGRQRGATARAMARTGINPNSGAYLATLVEQDTAGAAARAGAANTGRTAVADKSYARMGDVLNTYSGMASQAPNFYSSGTNTGNSAVRNQMAPGESLISGMSDSARTMISGRQVAMQGLTGIMNSQTGLYQAGMNNKAEVAGAVIGAASSYAASKSDRRLKTKIKQVGKDERTGLNLYEFEYINGDGTRYEGVMADEVESRYPQAVEYDDLGFASVNYAMLGIEFKEVA